MSGGPCPANFSCVPNKSSDLIRVVGGKNVKILIRAVPLMRVVVLIRVVDWKIESLPVTVIFRQKNILY